MSESGSPSILQLPGFIIQKICQLLIDSSSIADTTAFGATIDIRHLQLTCTHFLSIINSCVLKVPIFIRGSFSLQEQLRFCKYVMDNGTFWRVHKFYIDANSFCSDDQICNFLNRIKPVLDVSIKVLHITIWTESGNTEKFNYSASRLNSLYNLFGNYCNMKTKFGIRLNEPLECSALVDIVFPKVDLLSNVKPSFENVSLIQNLGVSHLGLFIHSSDQYRLKSLPNVTVLLLEHWPPVTSSRLLDGIFFVNYFPNLKVLEIAGGLYETGDILLPKCCEFLKVSYRDLKLFANCSEIKSLSLGLTESRTEFFEIDFLQNLKFSFSCLRFEFSFGIIPLSEIEAGLQRLLSNQINLKVLSVGFFGFYEVGCDYSKFREKVEMFKISLVDILKENLKSSNLELVIYDCELIAISTKLSSETIRMIDKIDSECDWGIRKQYDSSAKLDPHYADLILS